MTPRTISAALPLFVLAACSGNLEPRTPPSIAFDKPNYVVTLSADGTQILSTTPGTVTVTRGDDQFPAHVFIGYSPTKGNCGIGNPGPGFASADVVSPYPNDAATQVPLALEVCPVVTPFGYPRGVTDIEAQYTFAGKVYTAHATVTVQ